jgi:hypothetical protein
LVSVAPGAEQIADVAHGRFVGLCRPLHRYRLNYTAALGSPKFQPLA